MVWLFKTQSSGQTHSLQRSDLHAGPKQAADYLRRGVSVHHSIRYPGAIKNMGQISICSWYLVGRLGASCCMGMQPVRERPSRL